MGSSDNSKKRRHGREEGQLLPPERKKPCSGSRAQKIIKLNVGGIKYHTTLQTLTLKTGTMLERMFNSSLDPSMLDDEGCFFIDRDGKAFGTVLNYLRTSELPHRGLSEAKKHVLRAEAEYYGLEELLSWCTNQLTGRRATFSEIRKMVAECKSKSSEAEPGQLELEGMNFSGEDFSHWNPGPLKVNANNSNFCGASLEASTISGDWLDVDQTYANPNFQVDSGPYHHFDCANFDASKLSFVSMRHVSFFEASFVGADMTSGDFSNSNFQRADLKGAQLSNACLETTSLQLADFEGADLTYASLYDATINQTNFSNAILDNTSFGMEDYDEEEGGPLMDYSSINMKGSSAKSCNFIKIHFNNASFEGADLSKSTFYGCVFSQASFRGAVLRDACFDDTVVNDADFEGADLEGVRNLVLP